MDLERKREVETKVTDLDVGVSDKEPVEQVETQFISCIRRDDKGRKCEEPERKKSGIEISYFFSSKHFKLKVPFFSISRYQGSWTEDRSYY